MSTAPSITGAVAERDFEELVLCRDPGAGLRSVIAIHDTTLGPSLGGVRMRAYPDHDEAIRDALDLAEAMTYKAALAGLALGGGKSVIDADPATCDRARVVAAHGRFVGSLGGRYIPSVDMGTTIADLELMARHVAVVSSSHRDPSRATARGVVRSIEAALRWTGSSAGPAGERVAVQGLGHVGAHVVAMLREAGAEVFIADIDDARVRAVADRTGAIPVPVGEILLAPVDVLCPCAAGGAITADVAERLKARLVVGAANNMLADDELAEVLAGRGIVHVPDFVANAGGLMTAEADVRGSDEGLDARIDGIAATTTAVLERAAGRGMDTLRVARALAKETLDARRRGRPHFASA